MNLKNHWKDNSAMLCFWEVDFGHCSDDFDKIILLYFYLKHIKFSKIPNSSSAM